MVRNTFFASIVGAGLVATALAGPIAMKRSAAASTDINLPTCLHAEQACITWDRRCSEMSGIAQEQLCTQSAHDANTLTVECLANGNDIAGDVVESLGWSRRHVDQASESLVLFDKRDDDRQLVAFNTATKLGDFCLDWALECSTIKGAVSTSSKCSDGHERWSNPYVNSALVSCAISIRPDEWIDMTKYLVALEGLSDPSA